MGVWGSAKRQRSLPRRGAACRLDRQSRREFSGEVRKTAETSRSNLWRLVSCSVRRQQPGAGSACLARSATPAQQSAGKPADSKTLSALICGTHGRRQDARQQMGAGSACTLSWFRRQLLFQKSSGRNEYVSPERGGARGAGRGVQRRRIQEVQLMLPEFAFYPAAAIACRLSLPCPTGNAGRKSAGKSADSKTLSAPIYGTQGRR